MGKAVFWMPMRQILLFLLYCCCRFLSSKKGGFLRLFHENMNCLTDYHSRLLPMMGEHIASPKDSVACMRLLRERFGISKFYIISDYDCREESVAMFRLRQKHAEEELQALASNEFRIETAGCALVLPDVSKMLGLQKLRLPKTNYLPIRLSLTSDADARLLELNRLLYHFPLRPLFLSFDQYEKTCSNEEVQRLLSIPNAAYQFSYRSLTDPKTCEKLRFLMRKRAPILFGTEISSPNEAAYYELDYYLDCARREFTVFEFETLFFQKKIFQS
jgi:hypothetical protein